MGRRASDERPPIEVLGSDLGVSSTQQVALGPRRPQRGRGRGRALAIAAAVAAVLVGGLVLGGSDDDPPQVIEDERDNRDRTDLDKPYTSTTERRTTTTRPSTTTTAPLGPVFGEPLEGALLVSSGSGWTALDLTTGARRDLNIPSADPYAAVTIRGGIVIPSGGVARFYPILGAGEVPEARDLGPADTVWRAGPDQVWLVDPPPDGDADPTPHVDVRLVDLDGTVRRSFKVPGRWLDRATQDAMVVSRGGRVYAADEDGLRSLTVGWSVGASLDAAIVMTCDELAACALRFQPTDGSAGRRLLDVVDADSGYYDAFSSPDGRLGLSSYGPLGNVTLRLFGPDGQSIGQVDELAGTGGLPQWLPGDLGIVVSTRQGIEWIHHEGADWQATPIEGTSSFSEQMVFVVTP